MQNDDGQQGGTKRTQARDSEATSDETLSDLEKKEKLNESSKPSTDIPSPDPELAANREKPDESGPM
jgi:hypothetical protein